MGKVDHVFREQEFLRRFENHAFPKLHFTFQVSQDYSFFSKKVIFCGGRLLVYY